MGLLKLSPQATRVKFRMIIRCADLDKGERSTITRSSASSSSPSASAKVADRIVKLSAIDPDGHKREVIGLSGQTLPKALTNHGLIDPDSHRLEDIDACSAECEVHIAQG
ncbi:hypothetical protein HAX54_051031 [Datura stramonium]|uniref:Uncharacterized protein n=1 Tax=Datura stramonium TaxID=4076 RepID=A0ABS8RSR7_DATST|nr:hypothetical protein [Datura stramonium]